MPDLHVLRVFAGDDGAGGNPLVVFPDGRALPLGERQAVARDSAYPRPCS